ncbi:MAG: YgjP-like metallopeptidase domain-containing protein [Actinomycetota bacterium]
MRRSERRRRTVSARMTGGKLVVYLPAGMTQAQEAHWVAKMAATVDARRRKAELNGDGQLQRRAQELNREYFGGCLEWLELSYVTNQVSRFGSCSPASGRIRISDQVATMPRFVRDYVLMHELAHLIKSNHSAEFWALVNRYPLTERARGYLMAKGMEEEAG